MVQEPRSFKEVQLLKKRKTLTSVLGALCIVILLLVMCIGFLAMRFSWKIDAMIAQPVQGSDAGEVPELVAYLNTNHTKQVSSLLHLLLHLSKFDMNDAIDVLLDNGWPAHAFAFDTLLAIERSLGQSKFYKEEPIDFTRLVTMRFKEDVGKFSLEDSLENFFASRDTYLFSEQVDQVYQEIQVFYTKKLLDEVNTYLNEYAKQSKGAFPPDTAIEAFLIERIVPDIGLSKVAITPHVSFLFALQDIQSVFALKSFTKALDRLDVVPSEFLSALKEQVDATIALLHPVILKDPILRLTYKSIISPVQESSAALQAEKWIPGCSV